MELQISGGINRWPYIVRVFPYIYYKNVIIDTLNKELDRFSQFRITQFDFFYHCTVGAIEKDRVSH